MPDTDTDAHPRPRLGFWRRALLRVGIDATSRQRFYVRLRPRFFALVGAGLGMFFLGVLGTAAYSTSPRFCRSCHIMEPYYQAWITSKHNEVACTDCHYPPGSPQTIIWKKFQAMSQVVKFVTRTYSSKPFAEVEDASCLRSGCHSTRLLQGRVVSESGVLFDHRPHLEGVRYGRELRCASCHSQVVVGRHIEVTWETCYLCHLKGHQSGRTLEPIGGCQGCHLLPDKKITVGNITYSHKEFLGQHPVLCQSCHQDAIQGEGRVPKERCLTCHNQPEKIARYGEIDFLHRNHVTEHNTACFHCHEELKHGAATAGTKTLTYDCNVCHTDMHYRQRDMYRGLGAKGVPPMPSPMYLANVDCVACHLQKRPNGTADEHSDTYLGTEKGCLDCHGIEYQGILDDVHAIIRDTEARLRTKLDALATERSNPARATPDRVKLGARLDEASHNLDFVRTAHSVHNIYYAAQILRYTDRKLDEVANELGVTVPATTYLPLISGGFCASLCHAKVGLKIPPETLTYDGNDMPHMQHFQNGIACTECHVFGSHKEVKLTKEKLCGECH